MKVQQARAAHRALNQEFHARALVDERLYQQLEARRCVVAACVLVSICPEGGDTYFGQIIRQDGRVFEFDLSLDAPANAEWVDKTHEFLAAYRRHAKTKPWLEMVVAYQAFQASSPTQPPTSHEGRP